MRCLDTGGEIMPEEKQCPGCYLEGQPNPCIPDEYPEPKATTPLMRRILG